jgi:lipoate synthase
MLRLEARNSQTPVERKPEWIKTRLRTGPQYTELKQLVRREGLHTVCEEAGCPNIFECWEDREATFQIATGKPQPLDRGEPARVAASVATMGLRYATVTGVARDDLPDGGAWLYAQTAVEIHRQVPGCGVELLIPDFSGTAGQLGEVFAARPEVLAHNIETVPRIFRRIRRGARRGQPGAGRPARGGLRPGHDHPVPAALGAAPPGRAVGPAGGVRRARGGGPRAGFRRRDVRAAGPLVVPGRPPVPPA